MEIRIIAPVDCAADARVQVQEIDLFVGGAEVGVQGLPGGEGGDVEFVG